MAEYGYMRTTTRRRRSRARQSDRLAACGYSGAGWGENIAAGYQTADAVMQGWLASPGHRANIEQPAFLATGIGAAAAPNGAVYWAETFGTSTAGTPPPPPPPPATTTYAGDHDDATPATTTTTPTTTTTTPATTTTTPRDHDDHATRRRPRRLRRRTTTPVTPAPPSARPAPKPHVALGSSPDRREPRADRRFVLRFPVSLSARAARRGVKCRAHVGRVLACALGGGYARCVLVAPRGTKGRRIWGTVEVRAGGAKARRWFSRLVR